MLRRPLKNKVRMGLGVLMALAASLVLQLVFMPLPPEAPMSFAAANAKASTIPDTTQPPQVLLVTRLHRQLVVAMGLTLLVGTAGLWWFVEKRVFTPLEDMTGIVAAMSEGHLDQTLDSGAGTELDRLADLINTFSVNQQEGLLFAWNQAGCGLESLKAMEELAEKVRNAKDSPAANMASHMASNMAVILGEVRRTRGYLEGIQELVRTYYFYDVRLEEQKALAADDAD
jgi:methyl-accepting chemotaxis protein